MPAKTVIQHRRDTGANWTSTNPVLALGEFGVETDASGGPKYKLGDGSTAWSSLPYQSGAPGVDAPTITSFNNQTGTTYTLVAADKNKMVTLTNSAAITVSIPTNASVAFEIGTTINFVQAGTGQVTFAAATPATTSVRSTPGLKLRGQWSTATLIKWKTDEWILSGDTTA